MTIERFFPKRPVENRAHADALLELSFLMTSADGRLDPREREAFGAIAASVYGRAPAPAELDALVEKFSCHQGSDAIAARARAIAPTLPSDLRETAFQLGVALALVDRDAAAQEEGLADVIFEALALDAERAEAIAREVRLAFGSPR